MLKKIDDNESDIRRIMNIILKEGGRRGFFSDEKSKFITEAINNVLSIYF